MNWRIFHALWIKLFFVAFLALAGLAQAAAPAWTPVSGMQYNHVAYGNISEDGIKLDASGTILGAFGPGGVTDCRGVANIPLNQSISYYLTIAGNTNGETITFKLYDKRNDTIRNLTETLTFQSDTTSASFNFNYTTTPITYTISGNAGVTGAILSYTDGTAKTATANDSGNYSFTVSAGWSGTVTPSKTGSTFSPSSKTYTNVLANQAAQNYTITATVPGIPTITTVTPGNGQATVTFTAPASNGGSPITGYTVTSIPAGGVDSNAGSTATTHVITGLHNGTAYTFTVTASNAVGTSTASAPSTAVTAVAPTIITLHLNSDGSKYASGPAFTGGNRPAGNMPKLHIVNENNIAPQRDYTVLLMTPEGLSWRVKIPAGVSDIDLGVVPTGGVVSTPYQAIAANGSYTILVSHNNDNPLNGIQEYVVWRVTDGTAVSGLPITINITNSNAVPVNGFVAFFAWNTAGHFFADFIEYGSATTFTAQTIVPVSITAAGNWGVEVELKNDANGDGNLGGAGDLCTVRFEIDQAGLSAKSNVLNLGLQAFSISGAIRFEDQAGVLVDAPADTLLHIHPAGEGEEDIDLPVQTNGSFSSTSYRLLEAGQTDPWSSGRYDLHAVLHDADHDQSWGHGEYLYSGRLWNVSSLGTLAAPLLTYVKTPISFTFNGIIAPDHWVSNATGQVLTASNNTVSGFGYRLKTDPSTISDEIFHDRNGNGVFDANEGPLSVNLLNSSVTIPANLRFLTMRWQGFAWDQHDFVGYDGWYEQGIRATYDGENGSMVAQFKNNSASVAPDPTHLTFFKDLNGNYSFNTGEPSVALTPMPAVTDRYYLDYPTVITSAMMSTSTPPTASFTSTLTGNGPKVAFDASASVDANGRIVSYAWNFGDTNTGSGVQATHYYAALGDYTVTLTVTDNDSLTNSSQKTVTITNRMPVAADLPSQISVSPGRLIDLNLSQYVTDADLDTLTYSASGLSSLPGASFDPANGHFTWQPSATGAYSLPVSVNDSRGGQISIAIQIVVENLTSSGQTGGVIQPQVPTGTGFSYSGSSLPTGWSVNNSNGAITIPAETPPGVYTITILVSDGSRVQVTVTVNGSDTTAPTITTFSLPSTSSSLTVGVTLTATDAVGVTGYCLKETTGSTGCTWNATAPGSYVFSGAGSKSLYAYAKDAVGNISNVSTASVTITNWEYWNNDTGNQIAAASVVDSEGNIIITGTSNKNGTDDFYTIKIKADRSGVLWRSTYDLAGGSDHAVAVAVDSDDNVIVTGIGNRSGAKKEMVTIKYCGRTVTTPPDYDPPIAGTPYPGLCTAGQIIWTATYNGPAHGNDSPTSLAVDADKNIYVGGFAQSLSGGDDDFILLKYAPAGPGVNDSPTWQRSYGGDAFGNDYITDVATCAIPGSNQYFVAVTGHVKDDSGSHIHTIKYSSTGERIWQQTLTAKTKVDTVAPKIAMDSACNVVVAGSVVRSVSSDIYTIKYAASNGQELWNYTYTGNDSDQLNDVYIDKNNDVFLAGQTFVTQQADNFYTARLNGSTGAVLWGKIYDSGYWDSARSVVVDNAASAVYVSGVTLANNNDYDWRTIKYSLADGNLLWNSTFDSAVGSQNDWPVGMSLNAVGEIIVTGYIDVVATGTSFDYYAIKYVPSLLLDPHITYPLTVTKTGTGTGAVTPNTGTISWNVSTSIGIASYNDSTSVTLTAVANTGSTFTGWTGPCSGTGACQVTMNAAKNVTATFSSAVDTTAPTITSFSVPSTSSSLNVAVTLTATDAVGVTGYCLKDSTGSTGCTWNTTAPGSYAFGTAGSKTLYAYAKDAAGNISNVSTAAVTITITTPASWQATLTATGQDLGVGVFKENSVIFGVGTTAQSIKAGPSPPSPYSVYMKLRNPVIGFVSKDIRIANDSVKIWTIRIDPHGDAEPFEARSSTISWNDSQLGPGTFELRSGINTATGPIVVANMKSTTSFVVTGDFEQAYQDFSIVHTPVGLEIIRDGTGTGHVTSSPGGIDCGGSCNHSFTTGSSVTLTATADNGSIFTGWSGSGCTGTGNCTFTMNSTKNVVTATFTDTTAPTITAFSIPSTSSSLAMTVTLTATDAVGVTGYCLKETTGSTGCTWNTTAPRSYVFSGAGSKALYAYAKDAAENISNVSTAAVAITLSASASPQLPQTGQTTCYDTDGAEISCAGTGQDGDLLRGAAWPNPRFSNPDGTTPISGDIILDKLSGLEWTKDGNTPTVDACIGGTKTWQEALNYVKCLNTNSYLGHNDWRLPNINELLSLVHEGQASPATWLNTQGFSNTVSSRYWSSTTRALHTGLAWLVNFDNGVVDGGNKSDSYYVRAVRGGQSGLFDNLIILPLKTGLATCYESSWTVISCAGTGQDGELQKGAGVLSGRFVVSGEEVTDALTGLIWTKDANAPGPAACGPGTSKTWQGALDYAKCLNTNNYLGHSDWRLPNREELWSMADYSQYNPAVPGDHPFTNVQSSHYWSSTTYASYTSYAWVMPFGLSSSISGKSSGYYVRAVRGGRSVASGDLTHLVLSGNAGVAGATLYYTDGTAKTATANDSGHYSFTVSSNWSGTVTPSKTGYTFSPVNKAYSNVLANQANLNYTATAIGEGGGGLSQCDLDGDKKLGLAEVIYILQILSGKR